MIVKIAMLSSTSSDTATTVTVTQKWTVCVTAEKGETKKQALCLLLDPLNVYQLEDELGNQLPSIGDSYQPQFWAYGFLEDDECDETQFQSYDFLVVSNRKPGNITSDGDCCCRDITITYKIPEIDEPATVGNDPTKWCPDVNITNTANEVVAEFGRFLGYWTMPEGATCDPCSYFPDELQPQALTADTQIGYAVDECVAITNSAGTPYRPPATVQQYDEVFSITKYAKQYDLFGKFHCYRGGINCLMTQITIACKCFRAIFPPYTLKITGITGKPTSKLVDNNGIPEILKYWSVNYQLHYRPSTWIRTYQNRGHQRIIDGTLNNDDGNGGTVAPGDIKPGMSCVEPIKTLDGHTIEGDGVFLDAFGQPFPPAMCKEKSYMSYLAEPCVNLIDNELGLFDDFINITTFDPDNPSNNPAIELA